MRLHPLFALVYVLALAATSVLAWALSALIAAPAHAQASELPHTLRETGFFDAAGRTPFSVQYPLWSDGADKQRVIALPPGSAVDASNPDVWSFPTGTRLWKTFSHAGRPVETRYIERAADGSWRYATYLWSADGRDAALAPARRTVLVAADLRGGRYVVPGQGDCVACHAGAPVPVLGFSALQLSGARDPNAAHGRPKTADEPDLQTWVDRGLVRGLPRSLLDAPPRIAAASPTERAALGYLHANCSYCHHDSAGRVPVKLDLRQRVAEPQASAAAVLRSMLEAPARFHSGDGADADARAVVPGDAAASLITRRVRTRDPRVQMPPLGTEHVDTEGLALLTRWIQQDLPSRKDH